MTLSVFEGLFLPEFGRATNCTQALEDSIDQGYYHWKHRKIDHTQIMGENTDEEVLAGLENFMNFTAMTSDSLSRSVLYCPVDISQQLSTYWGHFDQFQNATIAEIAESFIFGILV